MPTSALESMNGEALGRIPYLEATGTSLLARADEALYASKKNGRNQVTLL